MDAFKQSIKDLVDTQKIRDIEDLSCQQYNELCALLLLADEACGALDFINESEFGQVIHHLSLKALVARGKDKNHQEHEVAKYINLAANEYCRSDIENAINEEVDAIFVNEMERYYEMWGTRRPLTDSIREKLYEGIKVRQVAV